MSEDIRKFAKSRGVPLLLHFTKADNIASIMEHGIVPVETSACLGIAALINDPYRHDRQRDATCVSIGFPNHRMFFKYRQDDEAVDWAVLAIKARVLWEKPCAFCQRNAADGLVTAIPIEDRMTLEAFTAMYEEIAGERSREEQKLKSFDPTHDQAEVLVFDVIEPEYIVGAAFNSQAAKAEYGPLFGDREVIKNPKNKGLFGSRSYSREY